MKTTVVGSYPQSDWLKAAPGQQALENAIALVFRAHERAGVEVVAGGAPA